MSSGDCRAAPFIRTPNDRPWWVDDPGATRGAGRPRGNYRRSTWVGRYRIFAEVRAPRLALGKREVHFAFFFCLWAYKAACSA